MPLVIALGLLLAVVAACAFAGVRNGLVYAALGAAAWVAMTKSGVDPVVVGLVMGLLTYASPAARADLERATDLFRLFREQPTPELARTATIGLQSAISPNERLQQLFHPWTSYAIVPLFALANAGIAINGALPRARLQLAGDARHPVRLRRREAGRRHRRLARSSRSSPAAGCGRRSAGPRSRAAASSPGSGSRSRC